MLKVTKVNLPQIVNLPKTNVQINPRVYEKTIYVSPCGVEHWISTDLFKFRLHAEKNKLHVIGACSKNYVPHYSLFCDEIVLVGNDPSWYNGSSLNGINGVPYGFDDIQGGSFRKVFSKISDEEVIERYKKRKIYMFKTAYDYFFSLDLPKNIIVCEIKPGFAHWEGGRLRNQLAEMQLPMMEGLDYQFQKNLLTKVSKDDYMSIQILASKHHNWQFFCMAGSSNLFSVVPVKALFLRDGTITQSVKNIVKGLSGHADWPVCLNLQDSADDFIQKEVIVQAFNDMSALDIDFEIVLI